MRSMEEVRKMDVPRMGGLKKQAIRLAFLMNAVARLGTGNEVSTVAFNT